MQITSLQVSSTHLKSLSFYLQNLVKHVNFPRMYNIYISQKPTFKDGYGEVAAEMEESMQEDAETVGDP